MSSLADVGGHVSQPLKAAEAALYLFEEKASLWFGDEVAAHALEQGEADILLEFLEQAAYGLLGAPKRSGGARSELPVASSSLCGLP